jgi:4'-phosphopantetheinyl transferase
VSIDTVRVWLVDARTSEQAALAALLDEEERQRLARLRREEARRRFVAAHGTARVIVGRQLDVPPAVLRWRRGRHGKPELAEPRTGLQVNLSHSGDLVAVAVTDDRPIGVDIQELVARLDPARLADRFFPEPEAQYVAAGPDPVDRFTRLWVRKEACLKAAGGRLVEGLAVPVLSVDGEVLARHPAGDYLVRDVPVPAGFRAAVAAAGVEQFRMSLESPALSC